MSSSKGLGRGLDALFGGSAPKQEQQGQESAVNLMPITALRPNPNQPRRHFDPESLRELADSIKAQGIIQPLLVRPMADNATYQIVAGERPKRRAIARTLRPPWCSIMITARSSALRWRPGP